jgi:N-acetylneuraminic acid mutarotase
MTTDGKFNLNNRNTVKIPNVVRDINSLSYPAQAGALSMPGTNIYKDDEYVYFVSDLGSGVSQIYKASLSDVSDMYSFSNWDVGGSDDETIGSITENAIDGYFYGYSGITISGSLGSPTGSVFRAPITAPTVWEKTSTTLTNFALASGQYVDGTHIYLIGGYLDSANVSNIIQRALLSAPTTFTSVGTFPIAIAQIEKSMATIGSNIYIYGGMDKSGGFFRSINTIYTATTAAPTTWTNTGATVACGAATCTYVDDDYVYLFGGSSGVGGFIDHDTIFRAPIATPTVFSNVGSLPETISNAKLVNSGDYIYLLGTSESDGVSGKIFRAAKSNPLTWVSFNGSLATAVSDAQTAVVNDRIWIFGGLNAAGSSITTIQASDSINKNYFKNVGTLPVALSGGTCIKTSRYLYIVGGGGPAGSSNYYRADLNDPTTWTLVDSTGPTRSFGSACIIGDYLWYLGGQIGGAASTAISRAIIRNGEIIKWKHFEIGVKAIPAARCRAILILAGNYVYLIGGGDGGNGEFNTVYRASSSDLGSWTTLTALTTGLMSSTLTLVNNACYIIGGSTNLNAVDTDDYVTIVSLDSLSCGNPSFNQSNSINQYAVAAAQAICLNDRVYLIGGRSTATIATTTVGVSKSYVEYDLINPILPERISASVLATEPISGATGSYSGFQSSGMLPWLVTDK